MLYESDLEKLKKLRLKYPNNPLICYLNINSLRNEIIDACEVIDKISPDVFVIAETKLNVEFPSNQFEIFYYEIRNRRDRNKNGGGLIEYVRKGIISKQLNLYDSENIEIICSEITIRNKKWVIFSFYRPSNPNNLNNFFKDLEILLDKTLSKYDNVIIMGDINIDQNDSSKPGFNLQKAFMDTYNLKNLIKNKTRIMKSHESSIDVMLTNKPMSFHNSVTCETGLSDHHMIGTLMKTHLVRFKNKCIQYRSYKNLVKWDFLRN